MLGKKPILKFVKVQGEDAPTEFLEMELTEFTWQKAVSAFVRYVALK